MPKCRKRLLILLSFMIFITTPSPKGRNRSFGERIGKGQSVQDAQNATESVIEGAATCKSVVALAEKFGVAENAGVLVNEVFEGDPADKAGIRAGDIITTIDGEPVDTPNALSLMIATFAPLAEVTIEVIRDGKTHTFQSALGERKDEAVVASVPSDNDVDINLGLNLQALTSELAEKFKLKDKTGVIISQVEPDSISQRAGLREGDLIKDVDQEEITSIEDFNKAIGKASPGQSILLRVIRENRAFYVVLNPEE